jgi:hypothetical protein
MSITKQEFIYLQNLNTIIINSINYFPNFYSIFKKKASIKNMY